MQGQRRQHLPAQFSPARIRALTNAASFIFTLTPSCGGPRGGSETAALLQGPEVCELATTPLTPSFRTNPYTRMNTCGVLCCWGKCLTATTSTHKLPSLTSQIRAAPSCRGLTGRWVCAPQPFVGPTSATGLCVSSCTKAQTFIVGS